MLNCFFVKNLKLQGEKKQNNIKGKKAAGNIENFFANASKKSSIKSNKDAENDSESSENNINKNIQDICEEQKFKKAKFEVDGERRIRKKNSKKNEVVKRKRIQVLSDSEDSDSSDHSSNSNGVYLLYMFKIVIL